MMEHGLITATNKFVLNSDPPTKQMVNSFKVFKTSEVPITSYANYRNQWFNGTDCLERYLESGNHNMDPDSVSYVFNSLGYRCDEFNAATTRQTLFIGCSITLGEAVPYDKCWAYLVYNYIRSRDPSQHTYINLGVPGSSWDYVSRMLVQVVPILRPSRVIAFLPSLTRREIFQPFSPGNKLRLEHWITNFGLDSPLNHNMGRLAAEDVYVLYRAVSNLRVIEAMCSAYHVDLVWSSWDDLLDESFSRIGIIPEYGTYFPLPASDLVDAGRDGMHPGVQTNQRYADEFILALNKKDQNNEIHS